MHFDQAAEQGDDLLDAVEIRLPEAPGLVGRERERMDLPIAEDHRKRRVVRRATRMQLAEDRIVERRGVAFEASAQAPAALEDRDERAREEALLAAHVVCEVDRADRIVDGVPAMERAEDLRMERPDDERDARDGDSRRL